MVPDGDSDLQYPEPTLHTHTTPEGSVSEPGYITREGSPIDSSSTSPAFTASPAFDTTTTPHSSKPISSTSSNLDISELDKSYMNIPQPSIPAFHLHSTYWTPYTSIANHPTESTSEQCPPSPKLENMSSDPLLSGGVPPTTGQALPPNFTVSPELLFQLMQQMHQPTPAPEPRTPEMSAKGHLSAPKFDDEPANLKSYFSELE